MLRPPTVAGQFYPGTAEALKKQIISVFKSKLGPKKLPGKAGHNRIIAAVVPHAGYQYSGPAAAHFYKMLAESARPDVFVIIGTNHTGAGPSVSVYPSGDWDTPLGRASVDGHFVSSLVKNSNFAKEDESAHRYEHSVEVQLPFLQYLFGHIKFVPIVMRGLQVMQEAADLSNAIMKTAAEQKKKVVVIASSDFTHFGPSYMYTPFKSKYKENLYKLDKNMINAIEKLDEVSFLKHIVKTNATVCGYPAITTAIMFAKAMKLKKGKLLKYYTSGDVVKDYTNAVGYASIVFSD